MKHTNIILTFLFFTITTTLTEAKTPSHPSQIAYKKSNWIPPIGEPYRKTLENGLRVYIAEDRKLPAVAITGYVRSGSLLDPAGKKGLHQLTTRMMRLGGTKNYSAATLDELLDRYAISIGISATETMVKFEATFLSEYTDTALALLSQVLLQPTFDSIRVAAEKAIVLNSIEHRFDNPEPLLSATVAHALYPNTMIGTLTTKESIGAITIDDMRNLAKEMIQTSNIILAVSGDFDTKIMTKKLEALFPKSSSKKATAKSFALTGPTTTPTALMVQKKISQAYVVICSPLFMRPHPDYYPFSVYNHVLGGGGFTSRLGTSVRSDRGLTYSIYSSAGSNYFYNDLFKIVFFTKSENINTAIGVTLEECAKLTKTGVDKEELSATVSMLLDGLPSMFRSKDDIADTYAWNEYMGRDADHFVTYGDKLKKITPAEVNKTGATWVDPAKFSYIIVGDTTELFKADAFGDFSLKTLRGLTVIDESIIDKNMPLSIQKK